jgi:hypothetical protein
LLNPSKVFNRQGLRGETRIRTGATQPGDGIQLCGDIHDRFAFRTSCRRRKRSNRAKPAVEFGVTRLFPVVARPENAEQAAESSKSTLEESLL